MPIDRTAVDEHRPYSPVSPGSPLWRAALERYYNELRKGGVSEVAVNRNLWKTRSAAELISQLNALTPADSRSAQAWSSAIHKLQSVVLALNDFAAVLTIAFGINGKITALIWGSIRLMFKVHTQHQSIQMPLSL